MDEDIALLEELIRVDSSTSTGNETGVAKILQAKLAAAGIPSTLIPYAPGRDNLVAEINADAPGPVLGFTGHEDVVDTGDPADWTRPPFEPWIDGDRLYGRGAEDMKPGLAALTLTLIRLKQSGFPHHVRLLATIGEEYGLLGAEQLTKLGYVDDLAGLIVGEGGDNGLKWGHGGSYNYRVRSHGRAAHSGDPDKGVNALSKLAQFYLAEQTLFADVPDNPYIGRFVHSVTVLQGGEQINTIPDYAELRGNARPTPTFDNAQVTTRFQGLVDRLNQAGPGTLEFQLIHNIVPVESDPHGKLLTALRAAVKAERGLDFTPHFTQGATDASAFVKSAHDFDIVWYGPTADEGATGHRVDEYVSINRYRHAQKIYERVARAFFD
ncbi:MAG: ArgE/DapE family deacylase [Lactobacillus sp.]|jgi:succinyl-diaminopimelate desuccinylase|nr:ArgE/DapE family deacylase [Lactobacillus sp.]MCI2033352.1 ArgE/DapE family deacylase [Lactobacillus sp.]